MYAGEAGRLAAANRSRVSIWSHPRSHWATAAP